MNPAFVTGFERSLLTLNRVIVNDFVKKSDITANPIQFIEDCIVPVLERIGKSWEEGNIALSQLYMGSRICEELIGDILPDLSHIKYREPKVAITVVDDYHFLGKRLVSSILLANGYNLIDYGRSSDVDELIAQLKVDKIDYLLFSVLMIHSALRIKDFSIALKSFDPSLKIIVGGAPFRFDKSLCDEVGGDATVSNASEVVELIRRMEEQK